MASQDEIRTERIRKLELLKEKGIDPYPAESKRTSTIADFFATADFSTEVDTSKNATLAGRIMSLRRHGALTFLDINDGTAMIQAFCKQDDLGSQYEDLQNLVDQGDFVEITGPAYITAKGQQSIFCTGWRMISKSIRALPDSWYGLKDEDERLRMRYVDMILTPALQDMARKRSLFWNTIRTYLLEKNFIEVETPVLENTTGGADACPFITHHNALDIDVFLRISAGELWQKKLLVGGLPRTFEIGRIFRNEGISNEHLQDYTQLEYYMAYSDYVEGMAMTKELYRLIGEKVFGTTKFTIKGFDIDLAGEWEIYDYTKILNETYNIDILSVSTDQLASVLTLAEIAYDKNTLTMERGIDLAWKKIRKSLAGPGFLINVPVFMEPLAKRSRENPDTVERFQVILAGSEMGKGFSELNDPIDQRGRFEHQQALRDAGDDEAQMADMEFVEALEYAMPPAFGFGLSERLFSFLMDTSVREAQLFPLTRPR
jgi:lysyl-tRNA synthetase class 2